MLELVRQRDHILRVAHFEIRQADVEHLALIGIWLEFLWILIDWVELTARVFEKWYVQDGEAWVVVHPRRPLLAKDAPHSRDDF